MWWCQVTGKGDGWDFCEFETSLVSKIVSLDCEAKFVAKVGSCFISALPPATMQDRA